MVDKDTVGLLREHEDILVTLANADCEVSWAAKEFLESIGVDTIHELEKPTAEPEESTEKAPELEKPTENEIAPTAEPSGEPESGVKDSLFAY